MFDHHLRKLKDRALAPIARRVGAGVSPNGITVLAFVFGMASAGAALRGGAGSAFGLWLVNRLFDGLDGTHARVHHRVSRFGAYLDILLDFVVYASIPVAIVAHDRTPELAFAGVLLLASFYVNAASWMYLAAVLEQRREHGAMADRLTTVVMPPGVIGGTETIVFYGAFLLFPAWRTGLFSAMAVLVFVNVPLRLFWAKRHL